jgi:glutamate dehydrogenase/leucine dehydrogenase
VLHGIRASVEHVFGSPDLSGRVVLVQGAGAVGQDLVPFLRDEGADVLVADVDAERARATGARVVDAADALTTECDVYAPCAVGGTLTASTIPLLRCRVVAGSANNQLGEPADAQRLHDRGILYAPDYVINAGGVLQLLGSQEQKLDADGLEQSYAGIGDTLREIYAAGGVPADAAERLAAERIAQKRDEALA